MPIPFSSALYYPYIDIRNERWLRGACLFWDSIRTIVPESHRHPYSSAFAAELSDEGVLEPVRVSSDMEEIDSLTSTVLDYLTDPAAAGVIFGSDSQPSARIHPEKISRQLRQFANIHPEKLPYAIREHFARAFNDHDGWYHVAPEFANFYMTLLASRLADRLGLGLITESSSADQLAIAVRKGRPLGSDRPGRHFEAFGPRRTLPREVSRSLLIDCVLQSIKLPDNVSAKELIRFKREHWEELALFRREMAKLMSELSEETSVEALRQAVHDQYESCVLPSLNSLRRSLMAQGWESALTGFLKVSFFSAAPTSAAILAGMPNSLAILAGTGISLVASGVLIANQRQRTKSENPYTYLLSLERNW